jgi:phage-related protein
MPYLRLPQWLISALSYFNFYLYLPPWTLDILGWRVFTAGDWLNLSLPIGSWILTAIQAVLDLANGGLSYLYSVGTTALRWAVDAYNLAVELGAKIIQTVYQYITNVYQTIQNIVNNVYQTITDYITNVYQTISNVYQTVNTYVTGVTEGFVQQAISAALGALADPLNVLLRYFKEIGKFFSDAPGWIFDKIDNWLNEEVE